VSLAGDLNKAAGSLVETLDRQSDQLEQARYAYRDHQTQLLSLNNSLGDVRREVLVRLDAMERNLAASLEGLAHQLKTLSRQLGTNGTGGSHVG